MKKLLLAATAALALTASMASADYTLVVPQDPGGGTSVWAQIIATQLEPFLGEPVVLQHQPGARDIPGFNLWANELRKSDPKSIMVSHGGNGESFLQEEVEYDYRDYESVGLMNLNIITARGTGVDPEAQIAFAAGSGMGPDAMAITMMLCGPDLAVAEYVACFKEKVLWVKGMDGGERRLAFQRGELNATRETSAAFIKHVQPLIDTGEAELWFHHGLLDPVTGTHSDDPNYPGYQFEALFAQRWGVAPSGDFYNAYKLAKSFRDGLQKALWMDPNSPHLETVRDALRRMSEDPAAMAEIRKDVGDYEWMIGDEGDAMRDALMAMITDQALKDLVQFNADALGLASVYKPELAE